MGFRYPQPDNEDGYEDLCLRFYRLHLERDGLKRYGKRGQRQFGIDLIDELAIKPLLAVQCKHRESTKELKAEEIERDVSAAEKAPHQFTHFIIATTAKKNTRTQDTVIRLNQRTERRFTIELYFWEDICRHISEFPRALQDYIVYGERPAESSSALQEVISRLGSPATSADAPSGDAELFPNIIQLFDQRKIEVAEYEISKLPDPEIDTSLAPNMRYGILRLRGKLALEKLDYGEACRLFFLAYETQPELEQAKYNRILAFEFSGQHDKAFEDARILLDTGNTSATLLSLFIRNAPALKDIEERKAIIEDVATKHEDVNLALAHALLAFGKFTDAVEAANRAVLLAPDSAHAHLAAGMTKHNAGFKGDWKLREENLDAAVEHYSSALQLARRDKYFGLIPEALINRARIHAFHDRDQEATRDYKEAVEVSGRPGLYGPDAVSFFLSTGDYSSAAELSALLDANSTESQFLRNVAKYGVATDDVQKRDAILATAAFADVESEHSIEARFLSVQWALDLGDFALAESCVKEAFVSAHPFQGNTLLGWVELEKGQSEAARKYADRAYEESASSAHRQEIAVLARIFSRLGDNEKALPLWEQTITTGLLDIYCKGLLDCAQRVHRHDTVLRICAELRECGSQDDFVRRLEVRLLARYQPERAIQLAKGFKKYDLKFYTAYTNVLAIRLNQPDDVDLEPSRLPGPEDIDPEDANLVIIPYVDRSDFASVIRFLYRQLRLHFNNPNAHGQYIWAILHCGTQSNICDPPLAVDAESAVLLENTRTAEKRWIVIENENPDAMRCEFEESHAVSKALLGHKVDDVIEVVQNPIQPQEETIREIQRKYVRLFQDSISNFQNRFPGESAFQKMTLGRDGELDPTSLIEHAKQHRDSANEVFEFYQNELCPIHILAKQLGVNELRAITALIWHESWILRCVQCSGREFETLSSGSAALKKVVLDVSALATIANLGCWEVFEGPTEYLVSRSTVDTLAEWSTDLSQHTHTERALSTVDDEGRLLIQEVSPDVIERQRKELATIQEKINNTCAIKSSIAISALDPKRRDLYVHAIGYHGLESISVAKDESAALWSDDLFTAYIAQADYGVERIWSQLALKQMERSKYVTEDLFSICAAKLTGWNYVNTLWTPRTLVSAGELCDWDANMWPLKHCLAHVRLSRMSTMNRAKLVLTFLKLLRQSGCHELRQTPVIQTILDALGSVAGVNWMLQHLDSVFRVDFPSAKFLRFELSYWLGER